MFRYKALKPIKVPEFVDTSEDKPYDLELPFHESKDSKAKKVLFIIEHVPGEDIGKREDQKNRYGRQQPANPSSGPRRLLSGATGDLFKTVVEHAQRSIGQRPQDISWMAVNWNCWRTYNKNDQYIAESNDFFHKRVQRLIERFQPDRIVVLGNSCVKFLLPTAYKKGLLNNNFYGVSYPFKYGTGAEERRVPLTPCLYLYKIMEDKNPKGNGPTNLIGYLIRNLSNGLLGLNRYKITVVPKYKLITTIDQFKTALKDLERCDHAAFDTETDGLGRVTAKMLLLQFTTDKTRDFTWILPFYHKDTPFNKKQLDWMAGKLANYFETNKNRYHIYQNGKFDLCILRTNVGLRYYKAPVWDVSSAEFCLDENQKFLADGDSRHLIGIDGYQSALRKGYYALDNILAQYSCFAYHGIGFSKGDRLTIAERDLDKPLLTYGSVDVQGPMELHYAQRKRAADIKYTKFESMVLHQESDTTHGFAKMEHTGIPTDIHYLFYLATQDSPIDKVVNQEAAKILALPETRRLDSKMRKERGVPATSLWGDSSYFNLNKPAHIKRLLFEELGLEPLAVGKDGVTGSAGKEFKEHYKKKVPAVAMLEAIDKAKKLKSSFVNNFLSLYQEGGDIALDHRIRPQFSRTGVVTGRVSESNPNMQQIPSRSELAHHIKRLFWVPEGYVHFKCDYVAHEVRGWAIISSDRELAKVFQRGVDLRMAYRLNPTKETADLIFLEGDSHRLNVSYFFQVDLRKLDKDRLKLLRDQIKAIFFGLIYGKANATLANDLDIEEEEVDRLVDKLFQRFARGGSWLKQVEKDGRNNLFVESPLGRRRHLWSYLMPTSASNARSVHRASDRKARNSPIQGMCSDFNFNACRLIDTAIWERSVELGRPVGLQQLNVVHDSNETLSSIQDFWWSMKTVHHCMTDGVSDLVMQRHGFKFNVPLEIDMEFGPTHAHTLKWDWDAQGLADIMASHFVFQERECGHKVSPKRDLKELFGRRDEMPQFLQKQIKRAGMPDLGASVKKAIEKFKPSEYLLRNQEAKKAS